MRGPHTLSLHSAYLDQDLGVEEMRHVAAHLEVCRPCEADLRRMERTRALLRDLPPPRPRANFWEAAYRRLEREEAIPLPWWRRLSMPQRSALVLAPAVLAMLAAVLLSIPDPAPQPALYGPDHVDALIDAHMRARAAQPLVDQGPVRMIMVDARSGE